MKISKKFPQSWCWWKMLDKDDKDVNKVSSRLLSKWPLVKILTRPVYYRVTLDTLSVYPESWSSKFLDVTERGLSRFSAFFLVSPDVLSFIPQTWHSQWDICNYLCKKPRWSKCIAGCVEYILRKNNLFMHNHIDSVGCVMFVERNSWHQETQAKKAFNLASPLSVTSRNCWGPGFWISTKGI